MPWIGKKVEAIYPTVTVKGKRPEDNLTLWVRPDGLEIDDPIGLVAQGDSVARISRTLQSLERRRNAGSIDQEEYEKQETEINNARQEANNDLASGKITTKQHEALSKAYDVSMKELASQRDGAPVSPGEWQKLTQQIDDWRRVMPLRESVKAYILATVVKWEAYADQESADAGDTLPVTAEVIDNPIYRKGIFSDPNLLGIMTAVAEYYRLEDEAGKKSNGTSVEDSLTQTDLKEASPNSTSSMPLEKSTDNGQPVSESGANVN